MTNLLDYLRATAPAPKTPVSRKRLLVLYGLAIAVGFIAVRAEYLNAATGFYLPRNNPIDVGKWRSTFLNEERWRKYWGPRDETGEPLARELTATEKHKMAADIARENANSRLRDWIETAGLLQYPLLLLLLIALGITIGLRPDVRRLAVLSPILVIAALALISVWYRGYFSSLER